HNFNRINNPAGLNLEDLNSKMGLKITQREFDILSEIYRGKSNKQICAILDISENTTKYHIKNLYSKFHVGSRTELLARLIN
ncbi:MAG: helix-turn-helix transcriptional regulator, partial [Bacteroidota bacterium]